MELSQLVAFDAVVRLGGFTRAAEDLRIAQPAVSAKVKRLEAELGVTLLNRNTRKVVPTPAGALFAESVRDILDRIEDARSQLTGAAGLRGQVRIGATLALGAVDLPAAVAAFRLRWPHVGISIRSGLMSELVGQLAHGELDLVIGPEHPELTPGQQVRRLCDERVVLVVGRQHRLAGETGPVPLGDLREELFVCLPAGSGLHGILQRAATTCGFIPEIAFEAHDPAGVRDLVANGLGVAVMAESTATSPGAPVVTLPLLDPPEHPPISLVTPGGTGSTAAARAFADHLLDSFSLRPRCSGQGATTST